jgi:hypothetical protein
MNAPEPAVVKLLIRELLRAGQLGGPISRQLCEPIPEEPAGGEVVVIRQHLKDGRDDISRGAIRPSRDTRRLDLVKPRDSAGEIPGLSALGDGETPLLEVPYDLGDWLYMPRCSELVSVPRMHQLISETHQCRELLKRGLSRVERATCQDLCGYLVLQFNLASRILNRVKHNRQIREHSRVRVLSLAWAFIASRSFC